MAKVFVIEGGFAGKSIQLMGRYIFKDGVHLEEDDDTAKMKATVLCTFYPCKMMDHSDYVAKMEAAKNPPAQKSSQVPSGIVPNGSVSTAKSASKDAA